MLWRTARLDFLSLVPAAYVHVLANEVARPMFQRWRTRRRLLKEAEGAVEELVREGLGRE